MPRRRRFYRQAAQDALVRFGPEIAGLLELEHQARSNLKSSVRSARGNARGIIGAVDRARPEIKDVYSDATAQQGVINAQVASHVGELGPVADSIKAAAAVEAGAASSRIGESRATALADLAQRRVSAQEGRQFAVQQARSTFADEIGQVLRRRQSLGAEIGAFKVSQAAGYRDDAAARALTRRGQNITAANNRRSQAQSERNSQRAAGFDPDTGKPIPGGKADPKASKNVTQDQINREAGISDKISEAVRWATKLASQGLDRPTVEKALSEGRDASDPKEVPLHDPVTGKPLYNPDGTPKTKTVPGHAGLPKVDSNLLLQAALEIAYDGHVSKRTKARLRQRGVRPGVLNIPLPKPRNTGQKRPQTGSVV